MRCFTFIGGEPNAKIRNPHQGLDETEIWCAGTLCEKKSRWQSWGSKNAGKTHSAHREGKVGIPRVTPGYRAIWEMLSHVDPCGVHYGHCLFFFLKKRLGLPQRRKQSFINFGGNQAWFTRQKKRTLMKLKLGRCADDEKIRLLTVGFFEIYCDGPCGPSRVKTSVYEVRPRI